MRKYTVSIMKIIYLYTLLAVKHETAAKIYGR